jgi:hypothetical protein
MNVNSVLDTNALHSEVRTQGTFLPQFHKVAQVNQEHEVKFIV